MHPCAVLRSNSRSWIRTTIGRFKVFSPAVRRTWSVADLSLDLEEVREVLNRLWLPLVAIATRVDYHDFRQGSESGEIRTLYTLNASYFLPRFKEPLLSIILAGIRYSLPSPARTNRKSIFVLSSRARIWRLLLPPVVRSSTW